VPDHRVRYATHQCPSFYEEPYVPTTPVVCFDEQSCRLLSEVRDPLPVKPSKAARFDSEYRRRGTAHVLMAFEPLAGWRRVSVSKHRRKREFAEFMRYLAEEAYPQADGVRVVMDNLKTLTRRPPSTSSSKSKERGGGATSWSWSTPRCMTDGWTWSRLRSGCWSGSA
jgi:hypothetical protein